MHIVRTAEAVVVGQGAGSRGIFVESEGDLGLDRGAEVVVPGRGVGGAGGVEVDVDIGAGACGGAVDDLT